MKRLIAPLVVVAAIGIGIGLVGEGKRPTRDPASPGPLVPQLTVARLSGDGAFDLGQLADARSPTLLWFWAPWCGVCNHEAAAIERLAGQGRGELTVVAIGGRDKAAAGREFTDVIHCAAPPCCSTSQWLRGRRTAYPVSRRRCCSTAPAANAPAGLAPSNPPTY